MASARPAEPNSILDQIVQPWYHSLADPASAQDECLRALLDGYARTDYGRSRHAESVAGINEFRERFPPMTYDDLAPLVRRILEGSPSSFLSEPLARLVMTRGSTGPQKLIPTTETHLSQILLLGARAIVNFALNNDGYVLEGPVLNLNFPSEVSKVQSSSGWATFGYSSGTYAKLNPGFQGARLVPPQDEVDSLGAGITSVDWDRRFELAYRKAKDLDVGCLMGVTPVMASFARYVRRTHGAFPKSFWNVRALFCTSVAKIQTRYKPILFRMYGAQVVEMYTATEGIFAQQLDRFPYVSPNYDSYVFEVETGSGLKMLHELRPGEWGELVVSTPILPRYRIGDLIEAQGKNYFRVLGRNRFTTRTEHLLFRLLTARF